MSRFFSPELAKLTPYTPGEQPQDKRYIKLNTNESPYPPAPGVAAALQNASADDLRLYSDPAAAEARAAIAACYGLEPANVFLGNGSDEVLAFAFQAFGRGRKMVFPDITYAFYSVFAALFGIPYRTAALTADFAVDPADYYAPGEQVVLANPNAITGRELSLDALAEIIRRHPDDMVIVDEAYVDFGGQSAVSLLDKFPNLLVVQTMSKSRQLAGARIGMAFGSPAVIADLNTVKFSFNPYNVNRLSLSLAAAAARDKAYFADCCAKIIADREFTAAGLQKLGFNVLPSRANFLLAGHPALAGEAYYKQLKERGILVRWFDEPRIRDFVRITIGSHAEMQTLLKETELILAAAGRR